MATRWTIRHSLMLLWFNTHLIESAILVYVGCNNSASAIELFIFCKRRSRGHGYNISIREWFSGHCV